MKNAQIQSYWSQDIANLLGISTSALRKWSLALEASGYSFIRDDNHKRAYLQSDIIPLRNMQQLLADGMGMENAAHLISSRFSHTRTTDVLQPFENYPTSSFTSHLKAIEDENKKLHAQLQHLQHRSEKHHESITQLLRQQSELRRMLFSAQQKRWWKFWT